MKIALIDTDNYKKLDKCFPNLALMKLSAWHKAQGDSVEWHNPFLHYDRAYMSKVFGFTPDYEFPIDADEVLRGGTGYCISLANGREVFDESKNNSLPYEIEHIMPDYSLYGITDTAYGYTSRGCPRGCNFCHVAAKEGQKAYKVADLSEFWNGQKNIQLCDPNVLACKEWKDIFQQLIDSKARVDFNQGLDIRLMADEKIGMLNQIKVKQIHFAWDRYEDGDKIKPKFEAFADAFGKRFCRNHVQCFVLCNYDTTMEQNLERIMFLRNLQINPYVMLYDKKHIPRGHDLKKLQRWCNNRFFFWSNDTFEKYKKGLSK